MRLSRLNKTLFGWLGRPWQSAQSAETSYRGPQIHVIILDGTMSSLQPGHETHAGRLYRMCLEMRPQVSVYYEAGIQWQGWYKATDVLLGKGINEQIQRAYGYLAARYQPGDRVFLFGYSRGAYAVRSLAGVMDRVGLLKAECAMPRNIRTAYRRYQMGDRVKDSDDFRQIHCHDGTPIDMIGAWDTVKALGLRLPLLWRRAEARHGFHNHRLGGCIRHGYHALALHETREVYTPVMWEDEADYPGHVEQVWFPGSHGDVGGQLGGYEAARPLANLSLVWMLEKAEDHGLPLPANWRARIYTDADAPSSGTWRKFGKIFLLRQKRDVGCHASERLHSSVRDDDSAVKGGALRRA